MGEYKVLIPTAGVGSRLGNHCDHVNKTLVPVANRPVLSYIVEKFPKNIEIIVDLGYKGELVQEFLALAYPERKFTFVWAKRNGLTSDLYDYKDLLQCPFIFFTNDAIVIERIPEPNHNWIGYANRQAGKDYRSVVLGSWDSNVVKDVGEKSCHTEAKAYIGICGIKNYLDFWRAMDEAMALPISLRKGSNQGEAFALSKIVKTQKVKGIEFTWYDTGTIEALSHANKALKSKNDPRILPKTNEHIWFCNGKVIKFSTDKDFIKDRYVRSKKLNGYIPSVNNTSDHMYCYDQIDGQVLSDTISIEKFKNFMSWIEGLWTHGRSIDKNARKIYREFYQNKTLYRIQEYYDRFGYDDCNQFINGIKVPKTSEMLNRIDWDYISNGIPVRFHGDLHIENILETTNGFCLLDWRQNFGGLLEYGDLYYDFAKLLHGLIVSDKLMHQNNYSVTLSDPNTINVDFLRSQILIDCEAYLRLYITERGYDFYKTQIITALIYLNMSPLHEEQYSHFLFSFGKLMLYKLLENE